MTTAQKILSQFPTAVRFTTLAIDDTFRVVHHDNSETAILGVPVYRKWTPGKARRITLGGAIQYRFAPGAWVVPVTEGGA